MAALLVLLFLALCNLPGQYVDRLQVEIDPYWRADYAGRYEHGWPFTFLDREPESSGSRTAFADPLDCWYCWKGEPQVRCAALAFNFIVVAFAAGTCGGLFEAWRRRRRQLYQFHVIDALAAMTLVACGLGWYLAMCRESARDLALIRAAPERPYGVAQPTSDFSITVMRSREGGITCLRRSLGSRRFEFLDRAIAVQPDKRSLRRAAQLSNVQLLRLLGEFTNDDLAVLEQFPRLEVIDLTLARYQAKRVPELEPVQLPWSPSVRALHLEWTINRPGTVRGIKNLRSLESLKLVGCRLDAEAMRELRSLTQLRQLSLDGIMPDDGCIDLGGLSTLEQLTVHGGMNDEESLRAIGRLARLRQLILTGDAPRGSLRHLSNLKNLEVLKLTGFGVPIDDEESLRAIGGLSRLRELVMWRCDIPRGSGRHLGQLKNLEVLSLAGATIASEDLLALKQLRRLKVLDLRGVSVKQSQYEALQTALPDCEIR